MRELLAGTVPSEVGFGYLIIIKLNNTTLYVFSKNTQYKHCLTLNHRLQATNFFFKWAYLWPETRVTLDTFETSPIVATHSSEQSQATVGKAIWPPVPQTSLCGPQHSLY